MQINKRYINIHPDHIASITYETKAEARKGCGNDESVITVPLIPVTMTKEELEEKKEKIEKCLQMISELNNGKKKWTMSVPARPESDPDLVISTGLVEGVRILEELLKYMEE